MACCRSDQRGILRCGRSAGQVSEGERAQRGKTRQWFDSRNPSPTLFSHSDRHVQGARLHTDRRCARSARAARSLADQC
ncbi:hypothetical protein PSAC2689_170047 [Paraburkholderia sacchari]